MMRRNKGRFSCRRKGSDDDDDDEDYVLNEEDDIQDDDDGEDSDVPIGFLVSSSDDDDDDDDGYKQKKRNPPLRSKFRKRRRTHSNNTCSSKQKQTRVRRRKVVSEDDDDDEDYVLDDPGSGSDDDDEFNPDEIDYIDEEEELQLDTTRASLTHQKRKRKRKTKSMLHQKHKTNSTLLKKPIKKKQRKLLVSSSDDDDDHDFDVGYRAMPHSRRNKRPVEDWDSDFACFDPSDVDEEEELLREANNFIHNSISSSSCGNSSVLNRRLDVSGPSNYHPPKPKRKQETQKVTTLHGDTTKQVCGICFSEEGKGIVRGLLNCCSHYFCFACIMEWSKVESRCPLCKQRFLAISKPARSYLGVDLRSMVIQVPKRDQVYQPSEEELRGFLDPYDGVVCMECQLGGDDCLMLLCDICDSPAHTYCVGLGQEVPEGNWYCKGCRISEPGPSDVQVQDLSQGNSNSSIPTYLYAQRRNVEHSDPIPQSTVSASESMNETGVHLSPRHSVVDDGHLASPSGLGVSTLSGRRRIHRQIRNLISSNRMSQRVEMATQTDEGNVDSEAVPNSEVEQIGKPNTQHEASSGLNSFVYDFWTQDGNPS